MAKILARYSTTTILLCLLGVSGCLGPQTKDTSNERYVKKYTNPFEEAERTNSITDESTISISELKKLVEEARSPIKKKEDVNVGANGLHKFDKLLGLPPIGKNPSWTLYDPESLTKDHVITDSKAKIEVEDGWQVLRVFSQRQKNYVDYYEGLKKDQKGKYYEVISLPLEPDRIIIEVSNRKNEVRHFIIQR